MTSGVPWLPDNYERDAWYEQRYDNAVFAARVEEGRCGDCGSFNGPDHRCPATIMADRMKGR